MNADRPPMNVALCKLHARQLIEAAAGCGCSMDNEGKEIRNFIGDMLASTLWKPYALVAGDAVLDHCICCSFAFPDEAIHNAIAGALQLRREYGIAPRLN